MGFWCKSSSKSLLGASVRFCSSEFICQGLWKFLGVRISASWSRQKSRNERTEEFKQEPKNKKEKHNNKQTKSHQTLFGSKTLPPCRERPSKTRTLLDKRSRRKRPRRPVSVFGRKWNRLDGIPGGSGVFSSFWGFSIIHKFTFEVFFKVLAFALWVFFSALKGLQRRL